MTKVDCNAFLSESESISFTVQCQKNLIFSVRNLSFKGYLIHHSMLSKHIWLLVLLFFVTAAFIEMIFLSLITTAERQVILLLCNASS